MTKILGFIKSLPWWVWIAAIIGMIIFGKVFRGGRPPGSFTI